MIRFTWPAFLLIFCSGLLSCKEEYTPPAIQTDYSFLVVEGYLNTTADTSFFYLSRTQKPGGDASVPSKKEPDADIRVLSATGTQLAQSIQLGNGTYAILNTALPAGQSYQVSITTSNGRQYRSDIIVAKLTPEIDSVTWKVNAARTGIQFSVNTHDASAASRYYRWETEETWEYRSYLESFLDFVNGEVVTRPESNQIHRCWQSNRSSTISLGSSAAYSEDFIADAPVFFIARGTNRFNFKYSVLVRQFALDAAAYEYWQNLKRMTEQGGSIFDAQPSELVGNIKAVTDPSEPVIGYITAHSSSEKRIFITGDQVPDFVTSSPVVCDPVSVSPLPVENFANAFGSGSLVPLYYGNQGAVFGAPHECADCTFFGGTNVKPTFW